MGLQDVYFGNTILSFCDFRSKRLFFKRQLCLAFCHHLIAETMLVHIKLGFRHSLKVLDGCPTAIALALAGSEFCLNVDNGLRSVCIPHHPVFLRLMDSLPFYDSPYGIIRVFVPQGVHTNILLEVIVNESKVFAIFRFEALIGKKRKERIEVMGLLLQSFINGNSQNFTVRDFSLKAVPLVISGAAVPRIFNYGQPMLGTYKVAQPCNRFAGPAKVSEFPCAVKRGRVPYNVIVNMGFVYVRANDKSVFSFEKAGGEIIADLICFFRRNFTGLKGLANLIGDHIVLFFLTGDMLILTF